MYHCFFFFCCVEADALSLPHTQKKKNENDKISHHPQHFELFFVLVVVILIFVFSLTWHAGEMAWGLFLVLPILPAVWSILTMTCKDATLHFLRFFLPPPFFVFHGFFLAALLWHLLPNTG
ncbi:hypothetical protein TRSC58_07272 [Trypanosoma rangeli SC58]|uniref:Uncharacterized protein n=1 Tax=Trypanosoma rangeli SC58 TaxID=429131 RepID=A0A061IRQ8_TRYRA|nr:hypothetical protein TRSC58_07272 [Trypanosoma rangeli SC58]